MTTINQELYLALVEAGASDEKAIAAARVAKDETTAIKDAATIKNDIIWIRWLVITGFSISFVGFLTIGKMLLSLTELVAKAQGLG